MSFGEMMKYASFMGGGGTGGGVSSWNDLTDKPFGDMVEVFPETAFQYVENLGAFVSPNAFPLVVGYDYVVRWNGVDYPCTAINSTFNGYPCVMVGNPVAVGGENNGLPFAVVYTQGVLGAAPLDGSTSVTAGILAPKKLHEQYVPAPTQNSYVYENGVTKFLDGVTIRTYTEPNLPLALLEAALQQKPIYMKLYGFNDYGTYDGTEYFGVASVAGHTDNMRMGLSLADKTSEIFKIPEGTVINGTEVTTAQMLYLMALRINARLNYYINSVDDFQVLFMDTTALD